MSDAAYVSAVVSKDGPQWVFMGLGPWKYEVIDGVESRSSEEEIKTIRVWKLSRNPYGFSWGTIYQGANADSFFEWLEKINAVEVSLGGGDRDD
jgi:hypothetical protein